MKRSMFPGSQSPATSATHVIAVGAAARTTSRRSDDIDVTAGRAPPASRSTAPSAAPAYKPKQRAHTGSCAAAMWNDRSGRWWQMSDPNA